MLARVEYRLSLIKTHLSAKTFLVNYLNIRRVEMSPAGSIQGIAVAKIKRYKAHELLITCLFPDFATGGLYKTFTYRYRSSHPLPESTPIRCAAQQKILLSARRCSSTEVNQDLQWQPRHEHLPIRVRRWPQRQFNMTVITIAIGPR